MAQDEGARGVLRLMRCRGRDELRCIQLAAALKASGCDAWHERRPHAHRSIAASVELGSVRIDVSVDVDTGWGPGTSANARIAFQAIDSMYLLAWFADSIQSQRVTVGMHMLRHWRAEAVESSRQASWCVVARTSAGWYLTIRAWPEALPGAMEVRMPVPAWSDALRVDVTLSAGRSCMARKRYRDLECGDAILVQSIDWLARIGYTAIGRFTMEEECCKLILFGENDPMGPREHVHDEADSEAGADAGVRTIPGRGRVEGQPLPAPGLDDLPVHLEFVLDRVTMKLADLRRMGPGTAFAIQRGSRQRADQEPRFTVLLRAGEQTIGEGELVEVDGALAVEVTRIDLVN
ncbi:type III secretion protein Q [Pararobbsia alpina]|uniref:FliM/FliN family flagellar motor switch protein n=1 Tax=Pararobbsia alpina TaxID=621374 RepID=UPI0039A5726C